MEALRVPSRHRGWVATSRHERDHGENYDSVAAKRILLSRFVAKEATLATGGECVSEPQLEWPQAVSGGLLLAASEASRDQSAGTRGAVRLT
jgi:hypothetical protein